MFIDNETDAGTDENQNDSAESTVTKDDLAALKAQNEAMLNELKALKNTPQPKPEPKVLSKEEFAQLLKDDPQSAIEYAVTNKITDAVGKVDQKLTSRQQAEFYDRKAATDFPLLEKDKKFQDLVKNETTTLLEAGMSKDSPMLVYKAAEIAALKYKGAQETRANDKAGDSGEAPSNVRNNSKADASKYLPKNFDRLSAAFNLTDKAKEKAKEIFKHKAEQEQARKNRGL